VSRQLEDQDAVFANLERLQAAGARWWDTPELARRVCAPRARGACAVRNWGVEYLEFGPNRSTHRKEVPAAMAALCERARAELDALSKGRAIARSVRFAVWVHAEIVRIHPSSTATVAPAASS